VDVDVGLNNVTLGPLGTYNIFPSFDHLTVSGTVPPVVVRKRGFLYADSRGVVWGRDEEDGEVIV